jgi:hypothetical protein
MHMNDVFLHAVVYGEREALREATVMAKDDLMDSTVHEKRVDIWNKQSRKHDPRPASRPS